MNQSVFHKQLRQLSLWYKNALLSKTKFLHPSFHFFNCWIIMLINETVEFPMKLIICFVFDDMFIGGYLEKKYNRCCFLWNDNFIKAIVRFSKWNRIFLWQKGVFTIHYIFHMRHLPINLSHTIRRIWMSTLWFLLKFDACFTSHICTVHQLCYLVSVGNIFMNSSKLLLQVSSNCSLVALC